MEKKKKRRRIPQAPDAAGPNSDRTEIEKIEVRAVRLGYYGHKLRKPGEVFTYKLKPQEATLPSWVKVTDAADKHLEYVDHSADGLTRPKIVDEELDAEEVEDTNDDEEDPEI